ncbi:MAG: hypothetical protein HY017_22685 [Betaproteobacteria bacterium]|nr:hypothetical protein [Betaproteobacteria bacterium]
MRHTGKEPEAQAPQKTRAASPETSADRHPSRTIAASHAAPATKATPATPSPGVPAGPVTPVAPNVSVVASSPAVDASRSLMGQSLTGELAIQGRTIPLPDGNWTVAAHFPVSRAGSVESVVLAQSRDGKLLKALVAQAARLPADQANGFRKSPQCGRTNLLFSKTLSNQDFDKQDCWTINHVPVAPLREPTAPGIFRAAVGELDAKAIALPSVLMSTYFRLADKQGFVNAIYYFNPESEGITSSSTSIWEESDWHRNYIREYPEKVAYFRKLQTWSEHWHARVQQAFEASAQNPGASGK